MVGNWLFNKKIDLTWLFIPVWITWLVCFFVPAEYHESSIPLWFWVVIIVGIDVSHVWSTLFRTYLDKEEVGFHRKILTLAPILAFFICGGIAAISIPFFWRCLAYLALYHFIKQQYGFMRLYMAKYGSVLPRGWISEKAMIYIAMLYPVFYWHTNSGLRFSWFVENDFLNFSNWLVFYDANVQAYVNFIGTMAYSIVFILYFVGAYVACKKAKQKLPLGLWLWIFTTTGNWFLGIVYFNSDFAFSLTNVIAHGIPYLTLIFFYVEKKKTIKGVSRSKQKIALHIISMVAIVLVLAFGEEYFWDMMIYRENTPLFEHFFRYPIAVFEHPIMRAFGIALLSLPQVTHYILDGYIWKAGKNNPYLKPVLLQ